VSDGVAVRSDTELGEGDGVIVSDTPTVLDGRVGDGAAVSTMAVSGGVVADGAYGSPVLSRATRSWATPTVVEL